jgi:hypothetical protein
VKIVAEGRKPSGANGLRSLFGQTDELAHLTGRLAPCRFPDRSQPFASILEDERKIYWPSRSRSSSVHFPNAKIRPDVGERFASGSDITIEEGESDADCGWIEPTCAGLAGRNGPG